MQTRSQVRSCQRDETDEGVNGHVSQELRKYAAARRLYDKKQSPLRSSGSVAILHFESRF